MHLCVTYTYICRVFLKSAYMSIHMPWTYVFGVFACVHAVSLLINILIIDIACVSSCSSRVRVCALFFAFILLRLKQYMCKQAANRYYDTFWLWSIYVESILSLRGLMKMIETKKKKCMHTREHGVANENETRRTIYDRFNLLTRVRRLSSPTWRK